MSVGVAAPARVFPGARASSRERKWTLCLAVAVTLGCGERSITAALRARAGATLLVRATAHQWWWDFEYPELGIALRNELGGSSDPAVLAPGAEVHSCRA